MLALPLTSSRSLSPDNLRIVRDEPVSSVFTVGGDFLLDSGSILVVEIDGVAQFSKVIVNGMLMVDGALQVVLGPNYLPSAGDAIDILDFGSRTGGFESLLLPTLETGLKWDNSLLLSDGILQVVAGLAGDYNANGAIDAADYVVWRRASGATGAGLVADGNGDLKVNERDYELWRTNFGTSLPLSEFRSATVPEPGGLVLLVLLFVFGRWCSMARIACR